MTAQEHAEINRLLQTVNVTWQPFPNSPQSRAYESKADVVGYGGAAGGGKTDLALGKAFTQFYRALILRREYAQTDGIIARGNDIQAGACTFTSGEKKSWNTPDGRNVRVAGVEHLSDMHKYKGRARDFIVFDEASDFLEAQVRFILGWLRTERADVKPQALLTFNPPTTAEGEWIVKFFAPWIDNDYEGQRANDGELRYFARINDKDVEVASAESFELDGKTYTPQSRTFFRASVEDNPVYMATGYDKQLESLPEPLRSQLRWGVFGATVSDDIWQCIPTAWIDDAQNRWRQGVRPAVELRAVGVDPSRGGADDTVIAKLYGTWFEIVRHEGKDVSDGATGARYVTDAMETNAPLAVDVIGYGASVYDHLKILSGLTVTPVNVGSASSAVDNTGRYHFVNLRSQLWWKFREALDPASGENIALPPDPQLKTDLRAPKFQIVGGKIKVESKDDVKKRIGRSTDAADAVQLAWYISTFPSLFLFDNE